MRPTTRARRAPPAAELRFVSHELPVELYGDFTHWFEPLAMERRGAEWTRALRLPTGVYSYKFRTYDGRWHLDPENPRTRSVNGLRNSLLCVGGSDEPVLHAPAHPLLFLDGDHTLVVRAGLRRGASDGLTLRLLAPDSDEPARELAMQEVGAEDEHRLFEVAVPTCGVPIDYIFVLDSGKRVGGGGQALRADVVELSRRVPKGWRDAVVYTILVDRFRRGGQEGAWPEPVPSDERAPHLGDLRGVREALAELAALGVTVLHLSPVAHADSAHRYDAKNPLEIDPRLGGEVELRALIADAHRLGLRVLCDVVLTHVHRDFLPFCDVRLRGPASPYASWFFVERHPFFEGQAPGYRHYQKGQWQEPLLRTDDAAVAEYLGRVLRHYLGLGVDGFRIDAAADVPRQLLLDLRRLVESERPDAILLGEVTTDNPGHFTAQALTAATDFSHQQALVPWLRGQTSTETAQAALGRAAFFRGPPHAGLIFTATHDQPRLLSILGDAERARLGHLLTLTLAGVPAIYYGDEIGLRSAHTPSQSGALRDFEDAWPDRAPLPWQRDQWDETTLTLFRDALRLRQLHPALRRGSQDFLPAVEAPEVLAFRRRAGDDWLEIFANRGAEPAALTLPEGPNTATLRLGLGTASLDGDRLLLGPRSAAVVSRTASREALALRRSCLQHNRALCEAAFRDGALASPSLPRRLYLTVTERCNLRCLHCITDAPAKTASGRARTLEPWLLDALDEAFAAADYFGFVHGGESLVAPSFFAALTRIQRARADVGQYDVHLLSNGMLLDGKQAERLIEHGVTSLAISLDGGSAATNDRLRLGADFATILANLEGVLAARARRGADLRVGVSTVITRSNRDELPALAERLADLGVDWLKLEEMVPTSTVAATELVRPGSARLGEVVTALRKRLASRRVVLVEHLETPERCDCRAAELPPPLAERLRAFRRADDFANRARFRPCRMLWEQACIDPDGSLHPVDYFRPALGRLSDEPLFALWNGGVMQGLRAQALAELSADARARCLDESE